MKYVDIRDLPPCSFSPQCLRLIDDLDRPTPTTAPRRFAYIEDLQDERRLRQLRSHLSTCPTCSALLAEARRARTQQRVILYHFLLANEQQAPSTSRAIIEALRREKAQNEDVVQHKRVSTQKLTLFEPSAEQDKATVPSHQHPFQHRSLFQNVLTLATVAAVILAAVGLLNRFAEQPPATPASSNPSPSQQQQPAQRVPAVNNYGWNDVLIGLTVLSAAGMVKGLTFYNYNAPDGQMQQLASSTQTLSAVDLEGISQDGQSLLYDGTSLTQRKTYTTYSPTNGSQQVYQLDASQGGNAVWMDAGHVLVQNMDGTVVKLDTRTGTLQQMWPINASKLAFYRQPFLYFIGAENLVANALYRMNLAEANAAPQQVTQAIPRAHFWLSIDGTTVFYANRGISGEQGIYAVSSDGTNFRLLRSGPGIPIGYAEDNALMLLQQVDNRLEVVQMGTTPTQPERVVLSNAAPGATSLCGSSEIVAVIEICDQNIALEPYGHGLLLHVYYANGSHGLVYDNLAAGSSRTILNLPANTSVQLPGWSKMSTAPTAFSSQAECLCA